MHKHTKYIHAAHGFTSCFEKDNDVLYLYHLFSQVNFIYKLQHILQMFVYDNNIMSKTHWNAKSLESNKFHKILLSVE